MRLKIYILKRWGEELCDVPLPLSSTCESCCAVWGCRSPLRSLTRRSTQEELELWGLCPGSPPHRRTGVCDRPAGSAPRCRRPRWCWPLRPGQANCGRRLQGRPKGEAVSLKCFHLIRIRVLNQIKRGIGMFVSLWCDFKPNMFLV